MSKNHPNDNIYSILGKLEALKPTPEEKRFALVKEIRESVEAQGSILEGVDAVEARLARQFDEAKKAKPDYIDLDKDGDKKEPMKKAAKEKIEEKAVSQAQQKFMGMVHAAQKGEKPASPEVAKVAKDMGKKDAKDFASTKHKGLPQHVEECAMCEAGTCEEHMEEGEVTHPSKGVTRHTKTDFPGYPTDDKDDDEFYALGKKGPRGRPRIHAKKEPTGLGRGRPKKAAVVGSTAPKMNDPFGRVATNVKPTAPKGRVHSLDEAMAQVQQNLTEGRYLEDTTGESFNHILNRFRAEVRNFEQGGDLDKDLYDALYDYYVECGEMPYGVQKARDYDPMRWVAEKLDAELGNIAYGKDPANAEAAEGMEMEAGIPGNIPAEQIPGKEDLLRGKGRSYYEEADPLEEELAKLAELAGIHSEGNAFTGKLANTPKGGEFELDGKKFKDTSSLGETDLEEEETDEGNAFGQAVRNAKADGVQPGEKVEVGGKEYPVKESFEQSQPEFQLNTSIDSDGNKTISINAEGEQAEALLQMLKIAGLGNGAKAQQLQAQPSMGDEEGCEEPEVAVISAPEHDVEVDEAGVDVAEPATEPANAPDPEYSSMKGSTMGPGEGDAGEKAMNPDRPTFKNGDNALSNPPTRGQRVLKAVAALESKLAAEYESIKKIS